jgi:hypothetical protein
VWLASDVLLQSFNLAVVVEEIGADEAYVCAHHFVRQLDTHPIAPSADWRYLSDGRRTTTVKKVTTTVKKSDPKDGKGEATPSKLIDARIKELGGWRGEALAHLRALIKEADPEVVEAWKWDVPVWEHGGIICTGETYKKAVKLTFAKGASLPDPSKLFTSSLEGKVRRAMDISEGAEINEKAFKALIRSAVELNTSKSAKAGPPRARKKPLK